jgi:hypothetical protein
MSDLRMDMNMGKQLLATAIAGAFLATAAVAPAHAADAKAPAASAQPKAAASPKGFATPDEAGAALADAVRAKDPKAVLAVVGPGAKPWLFSGDEVADRNDWSKFLAAYDKKHKIESAGATRAILNVGDDDWPFPAPLVKRGAKWSFDADAGREELLNRRVGRNELDVIQTLLAVVDAQREYAADDPDKNGFADYALHFRSSPGKKDGLFWPAEGAQQSPLGELVASAATEGYGKKPLKEGQLPAYHGYHYRIVTAQGKNAAGGAYDYMVGGKLLGGFAVVAWPASYGASGIMTFVVNHDGIVYEKNLGAKTASMATAMTKYDPDATWRKVQ